jgi:glycosyltransferase involved in cell wall biosynthesis
VIAVADNSHASGITTLLEAVAAGTPVVATRAGGLDDYFSDDEVLFVPLGSSAELAAAVERALANPTEAARRAATARAAQDAAGYWNDTYWGRVTDAIAELQE